jgi:hypothetical protein
MQPDVMANSYSVQVTTATTTVTAFASRPSRLVYIQADSTNAGTIQIVGTGGTAGPSLAAGDIFPVLWIADLSQVSYKASNSGDKINVLVLS